MDDLIKQLEVATGPSRELDFAIAKVLDFRTLPGQEYWTIPNYTSSIDAALTVIPPEYSWNVNWWGFVQLFRKDDEASGGAMRGFIVGEQRPAAIALCIAGLRARNCLTKALENRNDQTPEAYGRSPP